VIEIIPVIKFAIYISPPVIHYKIYILYKYLYFIEIFIYIYNLYKLYKMRKKVVLISIDQNVLQRVDEYVQEIGMGSNRSAFLAEAADYYLTIRRGIKNIRRRKILNEVDERTE
jgi:hypothetical protein